MKTKCFLILLLIFKSVFNAKKNEFHVALNYTKPDIVLGTESWLKGMKPGKNATKDAIKSCEIFG
jgi:hypothetical protein